MTGISWQSPETLWLLALIPVLWTVAWIGLRKRKKLAGKLIGDDFLAGHLMFFSEKKFLAKNLLTLAAFVLCVLALAGPRGELESTSAKVEIRDTFFLLDVSRSMLATDIKPNRLEHAKNLIAQMVDRIEDSRIALIAFSGRSKIVVPLTFDADFFKQKLDAVDTGAIDVGGTGISKALELTGSIALGGGESAAGTSVVLITDGEESDGDPVESARKLAKSGIAVYSIGIGDPQGAPVPLPGKKGEARGEQNFLTYRGERVISKLDEETLKLVAEASGGSYVPARKTRIDMAAVFDRHIQSKEKEKTLDSVVREYREFYQYFLGLALLLLWGGTVLREYRD